MFTEEEIYPASQFCIFLGQMLPYENAAHLACLFKSDRYGDLNTNYYTSVNVILVGSS
jgi:hypothetical protein